ncbi:8-amino-3 8-dideoxy-alpha-D-manno-octulosonate transaminase [Bienertia sinuspersici]
MSCIYIPKKLKELPSSSKKAWKSFTSTLSPKLHHLRNQSLHLTKTTTHCFLDHRHNKRHRRAASPTRGSYYYYYKQYNSKNNYQHLQQPYSDEPASTPSTVYIDRLFGESYSPTSNEANTGVTMEPPTSGGTLRSDGRRKKKRKKIEHNRNINNNWKEYVTKMPNIRGVDERAEEFISKFRQDMQIQREQSLIDFHEMLARSA